MCSNTKYIAIGEDVYVIKGNLSWFMKEHIYIITSEREKKEVFCLVHSAL